MATQNLAVYSRVKKIVLQPTETRNKLGARRVRGPFYMGQMHDIRNRIKSRLMNNQSATVRENMIADLAIHQPHFFPWLPYISRLANVSSYVYLDDVRYRKDYYQNRTRARTIEYNDFWWTIPVSSSPRKEIRRTKLGKNFPFEIRKIERSLIHNYQRAEYGDEYVDKCVNYLRSLRDSMPSTILEVSLSSIYFTLDLLEITPPQFVASSSLTIHDSDPDDRIMSISKALDCKSVLNGWGASRNDRVHDLDLIKKAGVRMLYLPKKTFEESPLWVDVRNGLSTIHTIMHHGPVVTKEFIRSLKGKI